MGFSQCCKYGESICGDAFKFQKSEDGLRLTAVLSDGLGSGVKANILSSMTAVMALKFATQEDMNILHAAETIMSALPICQVRKISYATFTIVNANLFGDIRLVEMGNPHFLYFRAGHHVDQPYREFCSEKWHDRTMYQSHFQAGVGDRILFFSDGISQAGIGTKEYPLGWSEESYIGMLTKLFANKPDISSQEVCEIMVDQARRKEKSRRNMDDMTCATLYFRPTKRMLLFTGPPYDSNRDRECATYVEAFPGDKVLCGGTTAEIVSRELQRKVHTDLTGLNMDLPPTSEMEGINLVTEGVFTLTRTSTYLENFSGMFPDNGAGRLAELLLRNDVIEFLVGTRINEAHQDPNLPQELDLRRNIISRMAKILKEKFFKEVNIQYV